MMACNRSDVANSGRRGGSVHEVLDLFDVLGKRAGFDLLAPDASGKFLAEVTQMLSEGRGQPQFSFGKRVEAMFEFVAASLGKCQMIKQEDCGAVVTPGKKIKYQPADYSVVTEDGKPILVEVKNHHASPLKPWTIRMSDLRALRRYAELTARPLYLAVFWSWPRIWTLVPESLLAESGGKARLEFGEAMKANYMSALLGDVMIGTTPPLTFRVTSDATKPRTVGSAPDGLTPFTIAAVDLLSAGASVQRPLEQKISWFLMFYGNWDGEGWEAKLDDGELVSTELNCTPEEAVPDQNFQFVGPMSSMMSRQYDSLTVRDRRVAMIRPDGPADRLGVRIPKNYKGEALPLWIFHQQPSGEVVPE